MSTDPSVRRLAALIADLQRQLAALSTQPQLANSSVEGGTINFYDYLDEIRLIIGQTLDATIIQPVNGPVPVAPSDPTCSGALFSIETTWDGTFAGDAVIPLDFGRVEVHVSLTSGFTPSAVTLMQTIESPRGGTVFTSQLGSGTHYIKLVTVSQSGKFSVPSDQATAVPTQAIELNQIGQSGAADQQIPLWDDAAMEWLPSDIPVPTTAGELTTVILPLTAGTDLVFDGDDNLVLVEVPYP